jgi:hypothetical protein
LKGGNIVLFLWPPNPSSKFCTGPRFPPARAWSCCSPRHRLQNWLIIDVHLIIFLHMQTCWLPFIKKNSIDYETYFIFNLSGTALRALKTRKNAKRKSTCTPKAHTQHNHDPGGPRGPPRQHSGRPSIEVRLARGPYAPSGGVRLARGLSSAPRTRSA